MTDTTPTPTPTPTPIPTFDSFAKNYDTVVKAS